MARVAPLVFDDFVIDLDSREVRRGGTPVSLSPKAFQLLGILVSNRAKAMSKRELQEQLWPETFVVEKNIEATPVRRIGRPEDIAAACAFLISEEAGYITGQILGVNGGRNT